MPRAYDGDYWSRSPAERLRAAKARLDQLRAQLEATKERLAATPKEIPTTVEQDVPEADPAASYDFWDPESRRLLGKPGALFGKPAPPPARPDPVAIVIQNDEMRRVRWEHYLIDFRAYVLAKLEYERLEREAQQAPSTPARAPSTPAHAPQPDPGSEPEREACKELQRAIDDLKEQRTGRAMRKVIVAAALTLRPTPDDPEASGCPKLVEGAIDTAGVVAEQLEGDAREVFRKRCTSANYRGWLEARVVVQLLGGKMTEEDPLRRVQRREPAGTYQIRPGDTLSKLAGRFYGQEWLWYVIFERNAGATTFPNNPDLILPNMEIEIP